MSLTAIFTGIIAIANAIPKIALIINKFYDLWIDYNIEKINKRYITKKDKRAVILKAISRAQTDEERKALSILLADVMRS